MACGLVQRAVFLEHGCRCFEPTFLEIGERTGIGTGKNIKQRIGEGHALLWTQRENERADRLVNQLAALGQIGQMLKPFPAHLPREAVVLPQAALRAAHDLIAFLMLQQHADDRRFRQNGRDPVRDALVFRQAKQRRAEAGAVVIVYAHQLVLHGFAAEHCAVDREIAALGVSAHAKRMRRKRRGCRRQILCRHFLRRNDRQKGQIKILLPADNRVVRAPEGNVGRFIRQQDRQRGELRLRFLVGAADIGAERQIGKAAACRHFVAQFRDLLRHQHAHRLLRPRRVVLPHGIRQENWGGKVRRNDPGEVQKAKFRHQQIVHLVEPALCQRQIAAPVQIIQNICHSCTSGSSCSLSYTKVTGKTTKPG